MVFRKKGKIKKSYNWTYRGETIEIVSSYKYLGVNFTSTGRFGTHLDGQLALAKSGLNSVYKAVFNIKSNNIEAYFKLFDAVARSVLCYAAQIWGFIQSDSVEKLQRFFIKKLFKLPYNSPNYMLLLETGRDPLFLFTLKLHWAFILHTLNLTNVRYSKIMLLEGVRRKHKWFNFLKETSIKYGNFDQLAGFNYVNIKLVLDENFLKICNEERNKSNCWTWQCSVSYIHFIKKLKLWW